MPGGHLCFSKEYQQLDKTLNFYLLNYFLDGRQDSDEESVSSFAPHSQTGGLETELPSRSGLSSILTSLITPPPPSQRSVYLYTLFLRSCKER